MTRSPRLLGAAAVCAAVWFAPPVGPALAQDRTITAALGAEPTNMDPVKYAQGVDMYYIAQMFEQLLRPSPDGSERMPWLAESYDVDENDGRPIITVRLRPDVTFHNGDPLTAEDMKFSWERLRDPDQSHWSHLQAKIESFEIRDELTFELHFSEPDVTYIINNLELWAMPKAYFEEVGAEGFAQKPVGTGPWKFVSRTPKEGAVFEAWDGYWNQDHRPDADRLELKILPEDISRVAAFRSGQVDWMDAVPLSMIEEFEQMEGVETGTFPTGNNLFFDMAANIEGSPFQDERVRQAVAHGADIDAIIESVLFGQGERYTEVSQNEPGWSEDLTPFDYDPAKAKRLLAEAGYPNGFETNCYNLISPREPNVKEMGEAFFAYLSTIGIRCKQIGLEYSAWIQVVRRQGEGQEKMDGIVSMMYAHYMPPDPGFPWSGHLHSFQPGKGYGFHSHANEPEIDELLARQRRELDPAKRDEILQEIARIKHEKVLGGVTTYKPLVTMAWHSDRIDWTGWPHPGFWRTFQEVSVK
ncbi:ABC transporter substrate-binding protein [uncultured Albimonas sp.]|uniref:ABC transporter substrate-binding protein n=1 Tax=uncultured Albimonas sp. TaxID=1331701 RepID=UPI0030EEB008